MRNIILNLTTSLDGYIEGPNGEIDWIQFDENAGEVLKAFAETVDTVFYGRISYDLYGNYTMPEGPESGRQFYEAVNKMRKYVFSRSLESAEGATVIGDNLREQVMEIKGQPGKDIWLFGGTDLITSFIRHDLIDEYHIGIQPVVLGAGKPLFRDIRERIPLELIKIDRDPLGVVGVYYRRKR